MRMSWSIAWMLALTGLLGVASRAAAEEAPPQPRFDGIDYARPQAHLALSPQVGDAKLIMSLAGQLKGSSERETLANISQWMSRNLRYDERAAYTWRTLSEMMSDRTYGGCADHAAVFGTMARAAGIPTVWVKSMDVDWIEDFRAGRPEAGNYRGHVFLEVFLGGRWWLLDADAMRLYGPGYVPPQARILPGHRLAYDKGDDPFALVLSCRWELWKKQTDAYFAQLDPSLIPWGQSEDLLQPWRVWVTGNSPTYRYAAEAARRLGFHVMATFNTDWDHQLRQARGKTLIVTCQDRRPVLPETAWDTLLPSGYRAIVSGGALPEEGYLAHRLSDGTTVILISGQDMTSIQVGVAKALSALAR